MQVPKGLMYYQKRVVNKKAFLTEQVSAILQYPTVKEANLVPIILGRPFLATSNAIINCRNGLMQLTFGNMTLDLNIFYMSKKQITPEEEEGPEELCIIDTLPQQVRSEIATSLRDHYFAAKPISQPPTSCCEIATFTAKSLLCCEIISQPQALSAKIFAATKPPFGTRVPLRSTRNAHFTAAKWAAKIPLLREIHPPLRKCSKLQKWAAKFPFCCQMISKLPNGCEMISKLQNGCENVSIFSIATPCETPLWLQNDFAAHSYSLPNLHLLQKWPLSFKMSCENVFFFSFGCKMISKL
ncbi:hypothetical protein CK203_039468 [Vitis vinifera]|uniref:Uncharacterized protein n=1 Tax=Vitis vinifera TaxID=29760 RepID=A0A438I7B3_VITVI|nr:hypothetical protein CK203_039468 [Vitis vinifera]